MAESLRYLPVSLFGALMGLAGLGLACRRAAGVLPVPAWLGHVWIALAAIAALLLAAAYAAKWRAHPGEVREEFTNPALFGYAATLPVGLTLLAGGLQPLAPAVALVLWWAGAVLLLALQLRMLVRLLAGGIALGQANAGWLIVLVGGIVLPNSGLPLNQTAASVWFFGASAAAAPFVVALVLYRMVFGPPPLDAARPEAFILLVPPAILYVNGMGFGGPVVFLHGLYFAALLLFVALAISARGLLRWPFGAGWWALTFPLDALALAALQYARERPEALWRGIAGLLLGLAMLAVIVVLVRTLTALRAGRLLAPPPGADGKA